MHYAELVGVLYNQTECYCIRLYLTSAVERICARHFTPVVQTITDLPTSVPTSLPILALPPLAQFKRCHQIVKILEVQY